MMPVQPACLLRHSTRRQGPDNPHAIDVRLVVGGFHVLDVGLLFRIRIAGEGGGIGEAQEEVGGLRFFDGDGEAAAGVLLAGYDVEAHPVPVGEGHPVHDDGGAEIEFTQQAFFVAFEDGAGFKAGQEWDGIFDAMKESGPELLARERGDQRVFGIVDGDQVFEFHGRMLAFRPCN